MKLVWTTGGLEKNVGETDPMNKRHDDTGEQTIIVQKKRLKMNAEWRKKAENKKGWKQDMEGLD